MVTAIITNFVSLIYFAASAVSDSQWTQPAKLAAFQASVSSQATLTRMLKLPTKPILTCRKIVNVTMRKAIQAPSEIAIREKQIVAGLFLSKFDKAGLKTLGFSGFTEAFNAIGFALGAKPASIKNYRDEFDPIYSDQRKGWHKRPLRAYCKAVGDRYKNLSLAEFSTLVKSLTYSEGALGVLEEKVDDITNADSSFAKRLITGLAAENYFESVHPSLPKLQDYKLENVSRMGCGFDFKLSRNSKPDFLAVEVKGLKDNKGTLSLTEKEYRVAGLLKERFFLFVVRNFRESPFHNIYPNPLNSDLVFSRQEKRVVQVSWSLPI